MRQPMDGISVTCNRRLSDAEFAKQVINSSIDFRNINFANGQLRWDVAFAKPNSVRSPWVDAYLGVSMNFVKLAQSQHWIYGSSSDGAITHIWLPSVDNVLDMPEALSSVTTLRLDRELVLSAVVGRDYEMDLAGLSNMPKLQRLYLSRHQRWNDLQFLKSAPNLQHLQIRSQTRSVMAGTGYQVCTKLETMRIFGTPDPVTLKELSTLPSLKKIEIVDDDLTYQDKAAADALRKQLPNVTIAIVHPNNVVPDVSEKWKQHLQKVRRQVLEKLDK